MRGGKGRRDAACWTAVVALALGATPPAGGPVVPVLVTGAGTRVGAGSVQSGGLFDSDAPLHMRIAVDLRALVNDRDSVKAVEHPALLTYQVGDAPPVSVNVDLKTRGHWRRQKQNCDFPPLRLDFPTSKVDGTIFTSQDKLKLTTPCRPRREGYEEYVLREYLVYKVYNLLTPLSLRARLARTTYVDTTGRMDSLTIYTFLVEDAQQMAVRNGGEPLEVLGARFAEMDSLQLGLMGVFLYMISGTDWSLSGLHNVGMVRKPEGPVYPFTYDFDWSGMVSTVYARPDSRLPIRTVRQRLYRGTCLTAEQWRAVLDIFRQQRAAIYAAYDGFPALPARYVGDTHRYLDDFYKVINDSGKVSNELIGRCRGHEGI